MMSNFYIKFLKEGNASEIHYNWADRKSHNRAPAIKEGERDRRIVTILRKYLDMELKAGQSSVLNNRDFETLGELLSGLIFMDFNLRNDFEEWYYDVLEDTWGAESYNIFLEFERFREFDDLAILPWEYIFFNPREKGASFDEPYLSASINSKINFFRKVPFVLVEAHDEEFFRLTPPLKILLIISNPGKQYNIEKLDELLQYFSQLKSKYPENKMLEIRYLYNPSPNSVAFQNELKAGQTDNERDLSKINRYKNFVKGIEKHSEGFHPDIIHYVGHGVVENNCGKLYFAKKHEFEGITDFDEEKFDDELFSICIKESKLKPKLVFLQVCNGGRIVDYVNSRGTAICLLEKQIPFVIAMQNPIQEDHAVKFTQTFYDNFMEGKNIGSCVTAGRYTLGGYGEFNQKAFGSPVLFTLANIPLSLNIHKQPPVSNLQNEPNTDERIIKYCNYPGCPYYGNENRYTPIDIMCTQGHPLTVKRLKDEPSATGSRTGNRVTIPNANINTHELEYSVSAGHAVRSGESKPNENVNRQLPPRPTKQDE